MPILMNIVLGSLVAVLAIFSIVLFLVGFMGEKVESRLLHHKEEWERRHYEK